jgi:hypothetical protein
VVEVQDEVEQLDSRGAAERQRPGQDARELRWTGLDGQCCACKCKSTEREVSPGSGDPTCDRSVVSLMDEVNVSST